MTVGYSFPIQSTMKGAIMNELIKRIVLNLFYSENEAFIECRDFFCISTRVNLTIEFNNP